MPPPAVSHQMPGFVFAGPSRGRRWSWGAGLVGYALVATVAQVHALPHYASRGRPDGDVPQTHWFLAWTEHAVATGSNPWLTDVVQYPHGVNLTWNTALLLPGLLVAPVTAVWGPIAADNLLLWLGLVGAMLAMRWCAAALTRRPLTAWLAGLAYGCSPYLVAQAVGHLNLALVVVPPLLARVLLELCTGRRSWQRSGVLLGLLAAVQFLITEEVLVSSVVTAAAAGVLLALRHRRELKRGVVVRVGKALVLGGGCALVLLSVPLAVQLAGPGALSGPATVPVSFAADLLGAVVPGRAQLLHSGWADGWGGNATENGSFLGPAVVALLLWSVRRDRGAVRDWALVALVGYVLSLGGFVRAAGHSTPVKLPFLVVWRLPLLGSLIPVRFTLYVALGVVLALVAASEAWTWPRDTVARAKVITAGLAVVVPLLPAWPYAYAPTGTPAWFTSGGYRSLPQGSVVQTFPVARRHYGSPTSSPVDWQATAGFWYRTTSGHVITRGPDGRGTQDGGVDAWETATRTAVTQCAAAVPRALLQQVRHEWSSLPVTAVVVDPAATRAIQVRQLLVRLTGRGPDEDQLGVQLWHVSHLAPLTSVRGDC